MGGGQPFGDELKFFNSESGVFHFPTRALLMDGCSLVAFNLVSSRLGVLKRFKGLVSSQRHELVDALVLYATHLEASEGGA